MNNFTKGKHVPVEFYYEIEARDKENSAQLIQHPCHEVQCDGEILADCIENFDDAIIYATAGTIANKLAGMGYDAVKVLEVLPEVIQILHPAIVEHASKNK